MGEHALVNFPDKRSPHLLFVKGRQR